MGKLLEVREFDSIICNENYKENENINICQSRIFKTLLNLFMNL